MNIFKEKTVTFYSRNEVKNRAGRSVGRTAHHGLQRYKKIARRKARKRIKNFSIEYWQIKRSML